MHLKDIKIENFRGIKNLKVEGFENINLFVGENNCGKTSILEALYLLIGASNTQLNVQINNIRGIVQNKPEDFALIFNNFKINNIIRVESKTANFGQRFIELNPYFQDSLLTLDDQNIKGNNQINTILDETIQNKYLSGLTQIIGIKPIKGKERIYESKVLWTDKGITPLPFKNYHENINGYFAFNIINYFGLTKILEIVFFNKRKQELLKEIIKFNGDIVDIELFPNHNIFLTVKNINNLVHLNLFGSGFARYLEILTASLLTDSNYLVMIDEIDNGLHPDAIRKLIEAIVKFSHSNNVQFFMTTHNIEILKILQETVNDLKLKKYKSVACYSVLRDGDKHKAVKYNYNQFEHAILNGNEIR